MTAVKQDLRVVVTSEIEYGSQGMPCTCKDDTERSALYCFRHLVCGYGTHVVGYMCHRCDAHYFFRPDWTTDECKDVT